MPSVVRYILFSEKWEWGICLRIDEVHTVSALLEVGITGYEC